MYKLPPFPPPHDVVLAMMLAYTNTVVFKTALKEERGEDTKNIGVFSICLE